MRFYPIDIPEHAHPLVRQLFQLMNDQKTTQKDICERSGINKNTFKDWKHRTVPTLDNFEAALNVLGYELHIRERKD